MRLTAVRASSAAFWSLMGRWRIPDAEALDLIEFPGKLGKSGKRPRFRLITRQQRLLAALLEIEAALTAIGRDATWVHKPIRTAPFLGRSPLSYMIEGKEPAIAEVLRDLTRAGLRASLDQPPA
jgi:hypothetical protein